MMMSFQSRFGALRLGQDHMQCPGLTVAASESDNAHGIV